MEGRKIVLKETAVIAIGEAVGVAAMVGLFALVGYFDLSVLWGGLAGGFLSVLNFFMMAMVASLAADRAQAGDPEGGQKLMKGSFPIRLLVLAVLLFAFAKSGVFHILALVIPFVFVRPILLLAEFFQKKEA